MYCLITEELKNSEMEEIEEDLIVNKGA